MPAKKDVDDDRDSYFDEEDENENEKKLVNILIFPACAELASYLLRVS